MKRRWKAKGARFLFILPALSLTCVVFLFPFYRAIEISLHRYVLYRLDQVSFTGFANYIRLLRDPLFWRSLEVTAPFVIGSGVLTLLAGLVVAGLLTRGKARSTGSSFAKRYYRIALLIPAIIAAAATGSIFRVFMFNYNMGLLNWFTRLIGLGRMPWLFNEQLALLSIILVEVWRRMPIGVLIFSAAIESLPKSAYEAAVLEGANEWTQFRVITLPSIRPQITFIIILNLIQAFRQFEIVWLMTGGGPGNATRIITPFIYSAAMDRLDFGYATAASVVAVFILGILCYGAVRILRTEDVIWEG